MLRVKFDVLFTLSMLIFLVIPMAFNELTFPPLFLKGNAAYFGKKYINIDENDSLSEYIKIPLGHNRTNFAVYSKINVKVEICSAL